MTKILIAEDDQFLANAYRVKFEIEGFEVKIAYDGEEAIATLSSYIPDILKLGFDLISLSVAKPSFLGITRSRMRISGI